MPGLDSARISRRPRTRPPSPLDVHERRVQGRAGAGDADQGVSASAKEAFCAAGANEFILAQFYVVRIGSVDAQDWRLIWLLND